MSVESLHQDAAPESPAHSSHRGVYILFAAVFAVLATVLVLLSTGGKNAPGKATGCVQPPPSLNVALVASGNVLGDGVSSSLVACISPQMERFLGENASTPYFPYTISSVSEHQLVLAEIDGDGITAQSAQAFLEWLNGLPANEQPSSSQIEGSTLVLGFS